MLIEGYTKYFKVTWRKEKVDMMYLNTNMDLGKESRQGRSQKSISEEDLGFKIYSYLILYSFFNNLIEVNETKKI